MTIRICIISICLTGSSFTISCCFFTMWIKIFCCRFLWNFRFKYFTVLNLYICYSDDGTAMNQWKKNSYFWWQIFMLKIQRILTCPISVEVHLTLSYSLAHSLSHKILNKINAAFSMYFFSFFICLFSRFDQDLTKFVHVEIHQKPFRFLRIDQFHNKQPFLSDSVRSTKHQLSLVEEWERRDERVMRYFKGNSMTEWKESVVSLISCGSLRQT
jgi:hypothetical protein